MTSSPPPKKVPAAFLGGGLRRARAEERDRNGTRKTMSLCHTARLAGASGAHTMTQVNCPDDSIVCQRGT